MVLSCIDYILTIKQNFKTATFADDIAILAILADKDIEKLQQLPNKFSRGENKIKYTKISKYNNLNNKTITIKGSHIRIIN